MCIHTCTIFFNTSQANATTQQVGGYLGSDNLLWRRAWGNGPDAFGPYLRPNRNSNPSLETFAAQLVRPRSPPFAFHGFSSPTSLPRCPRLEGNSHCLRDSWVPPPPGSPRAAHPRPAGGRGCSPSRPDSGTVTAAAASSRLMPPGSSGPAAGWPSPLCRGRPRTRGVSGCHGGGILPAPSRSMPASPVSRAPRKTDAGVGELWLLTHQSKGISVNFPCVCHCSFSREALLLPGREAEIRKAKNIVWS